MATPPAVDPDHGLSTAREFPCGGQTDDAQADDDDIRALRVRHGTHFLSKVANASGFETDLLDRGPFREFPCPEPQLAAD